jgi:hypothetical protein
MDGPDSAPGGPEARGRMLRAGGRTRAGEERNGRPKGRPFRFGRNGHSPVRHTGIMAGSNRGRADWREGKGPWMAPTAPPAARKPEAGCRGVEGEPARGRALGRGGSFASAPKRPAAKVLERALQAVFLPGSLSWRGLPAAPPVCAWVSQAPKPAPGGKIRKKFREFFKISSKP